MIYWLIGALPKAVSWIPGALWFTLRWLFCVLIIGHRKGPTYRSTTCLRILTERCLLADCQTCGSVLRVNSCWYDRWRD